MKLLIIFLLICTTVLAQQTDSNFTKGIEAYNSENQEEAIEYFEKVIKKDPTNAQAYLYIAKAKEEMFTGESTLAYINKAIELDSTLVEAYHLRSINREVVDLHENIRDVNKAISLDPTNYGYYFNRSGMLLEIKDFHGAIADGKKCFELVEEGAVTYMYSIIAEGYAGLGKYDVALLYAEKYIKGDGEIDGYMTRGNIFFQMGNYSRALEDYTKFAKDTEQEIDIYGGYIYKKIGETQLLLGDQLSACSSFQKAITYQIDIDSDLLNNCK